MEEVVVVDSETETLIESTDDELKQRNAAKPVRESENNKNKETDMQSEPKGEKNEDKSANKTESEETNTEQNKNGIEVDSVAND